MFENKVLHSQCYTLYELNYILMKIIFIIKNTIYMSYFVAIIQHGDEVDSLVELVLIFKDCV